MMMPVAPGIHQLTFRKLLLDVIWDHCLREDQFYLLPDLRVKGFWRRFSNGQLLRELTRITFWNFPLPICRRDKRYLESIRSCFVRGGEDIQPVSGDDQCPDIFETIPAPTDAGGMGPRLYLDATRTNATSCPYAQRCCVGDDLNCIDVGLDPFCGMHCLGFWGTLETWRSVFIEAIKPTFSEGLRLFSSSPAGRLDGAEDAVYNSSAPEYSFGYSRPAWSSYIDFSGRIPPHYPIWPFSPQTFRNRFWLVLSALSLPTSHSPSLKCLDPGSLRAGGATWLMQMTDNGKLVRRRGRWQNYRIMEVYIQEVSSLLYLQKVSNESKEKVLKAAQCFTRVFEMAASYKAVQLPTTIWFVLLKDALSKWEWNGNCEKICLGWIWLLTTFWSGITATTLTSPSASPSPSCAIYSHNWMREKSVFDLIFNYI